MKKVLVWLVLSILSLSFNIYSQQIRNNDNDSRLQNPNVVYAETQAYSDGRGVWLKWQTSSENKNLGFMVYRQVGKSRELASPNLIGANYLRTGDEKNLGDTYTFFDPNGNSFDTYYIENLNTNGQKQFSNPIVPQYISDIKTVAGISALELTANAAKANPIVQEEKALPSEDSKETLGANNLAPDLENQRWVASQPGVRIGVKKEGLYRVTREELQAAGFDVNSPSANWRLFLNGNEQSIIVHPNGDYIEFYGFGLDTRETDTQVYFLIAGNQAGSRIQLVNLPSTGNIVSTNFIFATKYKYRALYVSDILNGDADNFFGSQVISTTTGVSVNFEVPDIDCDSITSEFFPCNSKRLTISVGVQGFTQTTHNVRVELNGFELGVISGSGHNLMQQHYKISAAVPGRVLQGTNTLRFSTTGTPGDVSFLESISVNYKRKYIARNNQLSFQTTNLKKSKLTGFTSPNVRVFDLINPDEPAQLDLPVVQEGDTYKIDLPSNENRAMFAVEDSAILQPLWIAPNMPSALATTAHNANLLIVTHKNFTEQANTWAAYRAGQGFLTEVVQIEDVFDEFNYGASDSIALRHFFEYAKNNWQTPPQYILLIGDASYDYRNYEGLGNNNYIPTRLVDTVYMETGSDETLADFNDDGLAEVSIGRIPARTPETVTQIFNKTISFEQSVAQWTNRGALFVYDQAIGYDFQDLSNRISGQLPTEMPKTFIGRTYSTNPVDIQNNQIELIDSMSTGKYLVNYSGHGSAGSWTSSNQFFNVNNMQIQQPTGSPTAPLIKNMNNFSVYTMLTCLNGYFIRNNFDSLAETLLKARWYEEVSPQTYQIHEVGAAASWTSTGKTTPDVQEVMATRFLNQVSAGNMTRFGDLIMDAKTTLIGGRDVRLSWVLLGDPTMKLR